MKHYRGPSEDYSVVIIYFKQINILKQKYRALVKNNEFQSLKKTTKGGTSHYKQRPGPL